MTLLKERNFLKNRKLAKNENLPGVTFLVPCWNEGNTIENTIKSVHNLNYPQEKIKMVIVDDGSTDDTWQVLQKYDDDPNIKLITKKNSGKTGSVNTGLLYVSTPFVCSIDADTFLEPDALRTIATYALHHPELVSVGGTLLIHKPKTLAQSAQSVDYQMFSFSKKMLGLLGGVLVAPGAFSLYKTRVLRDIGGWRDGHGLEDLELTFRMQEQGMKVDHCHNAIAHTRGPETIPALFKQRLRWSYGLLNNTYDYRRVLFNKNFGTFGIFTVPAGIMQYFIIIYIFLLSWFYIFRSLIDTITQLRIQGFDSLWPSIDLFFFGTQPITILAFMMFVFIILTIFLGRWISGVKKRDYHRLPIFMILYGLLVPFWVLKSILNLFLAKRPSWR